MRYSETPGGGAGAPRAVVLMLIGVAMAACRSYEPRPLDLRAARDAWLARGAADEAALRLAQRLGEAEGDDTPFDPSDGLTLREAEPVALVFNRELRVTRLELGVARAGADRAGGWSDPVLGVDFERILTGVPNPWVVGGTLGLTLPISGRTGAERDRADAELAAEVCRVAAREWATRGLLRRRWVEWSAQSARAGLAEALIDQLRAIADLAGRQEDAGVLSRVDARVFRVELAIAELDAGVARAGARELRLGLLDVLGLAPTADVVLIESVAFDARPASPEASLEQMGARHPEIRAARAEYEVAERSLRLEVRKQYPDLSVAPGLASDEGNERVLLGLSLPFPLWNANRRGVAEASATRDVARGRFESLYEHLGSRLAVAMTRLESERRVREAVETSVLPLADEQWAEARRAAELGRVDPLLQLQAIRSFHEARIRLVDALAAEALGAIEIEELRGPPPGPRNGPALSAGVTNGDKP
ncbi:MAG: TolC family protein [Phycisphaerae bacterium]|nr:TolC family protein [Phycisphaerae bacterium]